VESKFGVSKRRYGLDLIMCKLQETSETEIMFQFMVMNAAHGIRTEKKKAGKRNQRREPKSIVKTIHMEFQPLQNCCTAV
jgi:hypothetical protein